MNCPFLSNSRPLPIRVIGVFHLSDIVGMEHLDGLVCAEVIEPAKRQFSGDLLKNIPACGNGAFRDTSEFEDHEIAVTTHPKTAGGHDVQKKVLPVFAGVVVWDG